MPDEIVMPRMGLTMETGTVVRWLKQEGERISQGEPLLEIETDKATVEIEALEDGTLHKIVAGVGREIPVGGVIAYFLKPSEAAEEHTVANAGRARQKFQTRGLSATATGDAMSAQRVKASPAARRLAKDMSVELVRLKGSGPEGRIVAWNVAEAAKALQQPKKAGAQPGRVSPVAQRVAQDMGVDVAHVQGSGPGGTITRRDVELAALAPAPRAKAGDLAKKTVTTPFTRIQRVMAERMVQSFTTAPHFYLHTEVDARQLVSLREQLMPRLEQSDQVHLTYTDLLIYFSARTLVRFPAVMAQWTAEGLKQFRQTNVGMAVDTENGLLVPVVQDADRLGLVEIARKRADLAERARTGKLLPEEFEEGVFTITNLGMYRVDAFDAILNPPQAAILSVGRIQERALVENGQVIAAPMLTLSLSVDHRVLDGARAARFLSELAETIEMPGLTMR